MMKRLLSLLLWAVLVLSLTACSKEPVETEPTEAPTRPVVEETVQLQVPLKYEGLELQFWSMLAETDPEAQVLRQAAAVFEKTTGAAVTLNWLDGDRWTLSGKLEAGTGVDIFEVPGDALQEGFLPFGLDLTEMAGAADYESSSWEVLRTQILSRCGTLKAIAYRPRLYGMYYNRDALDGLGINVLPNSWEEYLEFCRQLKENGYEGLTMDMERAYLTLELHMERALGWDGLKDTMTNSRWRKNETAATMIQEAIRFAGDGYLVKGTPDTYPEGQNRLTQSNAVLVAGSNLLCREVEEDTLTQISWGIFPYPGDGPGTGLLVDADVLMIAESCSAPEAAFEFVQLLTTGEFDRLRADVTIGIPADPSNSGPIAGTADCMAAATPQAPKWFKPENNLLFSRLWNGWYKTGAYFADQLNTLGKEFESEKSVG